MTVVNKIISNRIHINGSCILKLLGFHHAPRWLRDFSCSRGMPKNRKKVTGEVTVDPAIAGNSGPVVTNPDNTVTIKILAKPGAKQNGVTDISNDGVGVQIQAPPVEGEANNELVKYLSKLLGVKKSYVILERGAKSRAKSVIVSGIDKDSILEKIRAERDN